MNPELPSREMLADYIHRYCDESLASDELAQLEQWLSSDPASLEQFLLCTEIHSALAWPTRMTGFSEGKAQGEAMSCPPCSQVLSAEATLTGLLFPDEIMHPLTGNLESKPGGFVAGLMSLFRPPMVFLTLLTAVLCSVFASYLFLRPSGLPPKDQIAAKHPREFTSVAYLTSTNGCDWGGNTSEFWRVGKDVQLGDELVLHEGIAEFRLESGVMLSVEGPAALVLNSPASLVVQHGKLTMHVPWSVTDFRVLAATGWITACDAEFGIHVLGSTVDIHAFSGDVIVSSSPTFQAIEGGSDDLIFVPQGIVRERQLPVGAEVIQAVVSEKRSVSLDCQGTSLKVRKWRNANASQFATKLPMGGALPVSEAYIEAVKASNPIAYWRFESQEGGIIPNEISPDLKLTVMGNLRLSLRDDNHVAEFGRPGTEAVLVTEEPIDSLSKGDYSLEVWVKPSHIHRGGLLAMVVDPLTVNERHASYLALLSSNALGQRDIYSRKHPEAIRFLHRSPPSGDTTNGTSCFSKKPYSVRRWQHVVAVRSGTEMKLYTDGSLVGTAQGDNNLPGGLHLVVGGPHTLASDRRFVGQLDELAIYDRALTKEEIVKHSNSVPWKQVADKGQIY